MVLRETISVLIICFCLSAIASAQKADSNSATIPPASAEEKTQDFSDTVVPITLIKITPSARLGLSGRPVPRLDQAAYFGTGFCLDAACRFIVTNYHVAMTARAGKVKGEKIIQRYFATGPQDKEATANFLPNWGVLPYARKRDLAILELQRSLPHHHGLAFSLDELEVGQQVDIYGYPKGIINPIRKLTRFAATFQAPTRSGLLAFEYQSSSDKPVRIEGASGGIVVDRKTGRIVGILCGTTETAALAVPVQTLADLVSKEQPFLAKRIFPATDAISPISTDVYPKFVPSRVQELQHRSEEPRGVILLREKAQALAKSMREFIAVQTFAWGSEDKEPVAEASYEVRIIGGQQRFRKYPDGENELVQMPFPHLNDWVLPSDEWSGLPKMVGTELRLRVHQAADALVGNRRVKVFQYHADVEDDLCPFAPSEDFGFFRVQKALAVACYGEVWTDEDTNVIRMSENLELSDKLKAYRGWQDYQIVLTYGWLKQADESVQLVPLTILTQARHGKHVYWCRGFFTHYHVFAVRARLISN